MCVAGSGQGEIFMYINKTLAEKSVFAFRYPLTSQFELCVCRVYTPKFMRGLHAAEQLLKHYSNSSGRLTRVTTI